MIIEKKRKKKKRGNRRSRFSVKGLDITADWCFLFEFEGGNIGGILHDTVTAIESAKSWEGWSQEDRGGGVGKK